MKRLREPRQPVEKQLAFLNQLICVPNTFYHWFCLYQNVSQKAAHLLEGRVGSQALYIP
jgi:cupin superfamily acireductone dioxygenase involved in methionine salvage